MERVILHCDLNSFYASVEIHNNPELIGKAVAVCGSQEERHGIVLAKSDLAKKAGVQTGEAIWQATQKCPDLIIVQPHYDEYMRFSKLARKIYEDYTDLIEPFGIDECWLDVTGSQILFGNGETIANKIRERMKAEVGLTISVGVSFNKVFAKLGSDIKKPDAVTVIPFNTFKEKIWNLPAGDMLGVGRATQKVLHSYCIETIGDLANANVEMIERRLGKAGQQIWNFANGYDRSPVQNMSYSAPIKSIGHGTTCVADLTSDNEVWKVILELSQDISHRLREYGLMANGVQLTVKDNQLLSKQYQCPLEISSQSFVEIAQMSFKLFQKHYQWKMDVRAVTVRAINLCDVHTPVQLNFTMDITQHEKRDKIELAIERIRKRYGRAAINMGSLYTDLKMAGQQNLIMPSGIPQQ